MPKNIILVSLISALFGLLTLSAWAVSSPPGSSPDENFHIGSIWCGENFNDNNCKLISDNITDNSVVVQTPHVMDVCFIFYPDQSANCSSDERSKTTTLMANNGLYPSGYYKFMNLFVSGNSSLSIVSMRIVNSLIFLIMFFAALSLSSGLIRTSLVISVTATLIPLAIFLIPSVNPSSWAYTAAATNWVFLKNLFQRTEKSTSRKYLNLFLYLVTILMALSSRWDVMTYIAISTFAVLALVPKASRRNPLYILSILGAIALAYQSIFSRINIGSATVVGFGGGDNSLNTTFLIRNNLQNLITLYAGNAGYNWGIGWLDTKLPEIVGILGILVWGIWTGRMLPQNSIQAYATSLFLFAIIVFIPMYILVTEKLLVGQQLQPRYLLPLTPIFFGLVLSSAHIENLRLTAIKSNLNITVILVSISNLFSLHTNFRRYLTGLDYNEINLNLHKEWWWSTKIDPNLVFITGAISFLVMGYLVVNYLLDSDLDLESVEEARKLPLKD